MKSYYIIPGIVALTALGAQAASIGVNFGAGRGGASLATTDSAGVVAQTNWNNAAGASGSISALVDNNGAASGAAVVWQTDEQWSNGSPVEPNGKLLLGWIAEQDSATTPSTIDVTAIPYAQYDLYFYLSHDRSFEDVRLTEANGAFPQFDAVENNPNLSNPVVWTEQTTSATTAGNYVHFRGLTATDLSITLGAVDVNYNGGGSSDRNAINGLQIVEVPEPSALLLGLAGLLFIRRRRA
jgi:hypothetical protein